MPSRSERCFSVASGGEVTALQVVCPHAGCSINFEGSAAGRQVLLPLPRRQLRSFRQADDTTSPSPRDMDALDVEIRNRKEVWVKFQTFGVGTAKKCPRIERL